MTALVVYYSRFGFAVAADGFQRWNDPATRDKGIRRKERTNAQKIFEIRCDGVDMVYALCGDVANEDRSLDLDKILRDEFKHVHANETQDCYAFVATAGERVERRLRDLQWYPKAHVPVFGYFRGNPSWMELSFRKPKGSVVRILDVEEHPLYADSVIPYVPDVIVRLNDYRDPRFPILWSQLSFVDSIDGAVGYVQRYVDTCIAAEAAEVDQDDRQTGGHVHIAIVCSESGFEWRIPPL